MKLSRTWLPIGLLLVALVSTPADAVTHTVKPDGSGDFPTIQDAVNAAENGDVIELTNGVFMGDGNRDIQYLGKPIIIRSQSGYPELCVIDCGDRDAIYNRGFEFAFGEDSNARLEGVTITNGTAGGDD